MSKRILTKEQIKELLKNKNVDKCGERYITYGKKFKQTALKQYYEEGMPPNEIFRSAGLDINIIGRHTPKECLRRWKGRRKTKKKSDSVLKKKIGRPKKNRLEGKDKIEWMEAEIAYLKAENAFLAKLRAKRAE